LPCTYATLATPPHDARFISSDAQLVEGFRRLAFGKHCLSDACFEVGKLHRLKLGSSVSRDACFIASWLVQKRVSKMEISVLRDACSMLIKLRREGFVKDVKDLRA
jgi:hypothetical protein